MREDHRSPWLGPEGLAVEHQHTQEVQPAHEEQADNDQERNERRLWRHQHKQRHDQPDQRDDRDRQLDELEHDPEK